MKLLNRKLYIGQIAWLDRAKNVGLVRLSDGTTVSIKSEDIQLGPPMPFYGHLVVFRYNPEAAGHRILTSSESNLGPG